jgi:tripeptide aminopeptidase
VDINKERLKKEFLALVKISSESKNEKDVAEYIKKAFDGLADEILFDTSKEKTKSNTDNLIVKVRGTNKGTPSLLLCAHLDTVVPGKDIKPIEEGGVIKADGSTILGADCKSGIAIILEVIRSLKEHGADHGDIEVLFTVCEEVGLLGSKNLDYSLIESKLCYAIDTVGAVSVINKAPSSNSIKFTIYGKEAHAGVEPEKGISAIKVAARAIELMELGRIDFETTANIGVITGGHATNIVPNMVVLEGEARSHDPEKLKAQTESMQEAVKKAVAEYTDKSFDDELPYYEEEISLEYERFSVSEESPLIKKCSEAAKELGKELRVIAAGGGSDANIFNAHGIESVIFASGMKNPHTVNESIDLNDLYLNTSLLLNTVLTF